MLINYLPFQDLWIVIILWSLYYYGDYYFTRHISIHSPPILGKHFIHNGSHEIDPRLQNDIDKGHLFSIPHILSWFVTCIGFYIIWRFSKIGDFPLLFQWYSGLLFLLFGVSYLRHFRNFASYKSYSDGDIDGKVEYKESYDIIQSSWELLGFSIFYLFISIILGSWFFFGGFVSCIIVANNHRLLSKNVTDNNN